MLGRFSCVWLFVTLWIVAHQALLPMAFSKWEYWSGLPCLFSRDLPNSGIKSTSPVSPASVCVFFTPGATDLHSLWSSLWFIKNKSHEEGWALKNLCFQIVVLEETFESPLDYKEIKPGDSRGNQSWKFNERADGEDEAPILWPPDVKNQLIGKDPDPGKDQRQEETRTTEDEMVGWHYRLNGHEFEQIPGDGEGQGNLVCCSPWSHKESDKTGQLNKFFKLHFIPALQYGINYLLRN